MNRRKGPKRQGGRGRQRYAPRRPAPLSPWLIIGYGSDLRGDDGAGPRAVGGLGGLGRARRIVARQLTPELAAELAGARRAVFVDARAGRGGVRLARLAPAAGPAALDAHLSDPAALLALALALYGRAPRAWLLTIPGRSFELGAPLSPRARRGVTVARRRLRALLG